MARNLDWNGLSTRDFAALDPQKMIAILPVCSTEQHGPHLPVATDSAIGIGMLDLLRQRLPDDLSVLILPVQEVGKANEHFYGPGTLSISAENLIRIWTEIGESVSRSGLRKLVFVNSHGGNVDVMNIVVRELRLRFSMLAVATQWTRFGAPDGLYSERERRFGIHGGDLETSLMLNFRPDLVRMELAEDFVSLHEQMAQENAFLQPIAPHGMGWIAHDLNPAGAVGEAHKATAEKGRLTAEHEIAGFIELLRDVERFDLQKLYRP